MAAGIAALPPFLTALGVAIARGSVTFELTQRLGAGYCSWAALANILIGFFMYWEASLFDMRVMVDIIGPALLLAAISLIWIWHNYSAAAVHAVRYTFFGFASEWKNSILISE